jgi:hypothetical protein
MIPRHLRRDAAKGCVVDQANVHDSLGSLISDGVKFRLIVLLPSSDLLTKWSDNAVLNKDIAEELPISEIRGGSERDPINLLIMLCSTSESARSCRSHSAASTISGQVGLAAADTA